MPEDQLSDRESLVLALFRYGLAVDADDVAQQLRTNPVEAARICQRLELVGVI